MASFSSKLAFYDPSENLHYLRAILTRCRQVGRNALVMILVLKFSVKAYNTKSLTSGG